MLTWRGFLVRTSLVLKDIILYCFSFMSIINVSISCVSKPCLHPFLSSQCRLVGALHFYNINKIFHVSLFSIDIICFMYGIYSKSSITLATLSQYTCTLYSQSHANTEGFTKNRHTVDHNGRSTLSLFVTTRGHWQAVDDVPSNHVFSQYVDRYLFCKRRG